MAKALKSFKDAGDYDAPICKWEARPAIAQTYANLKTLMCTEYSKFNHQDATTARATGHASVNNIAEEMAQGMEELVVELMEKHSKQIEPIIKANNEAMQNSPPQFWPISQHPLLPQHPAAAKPRPKRWQRQWHGKKRRRRQQLVPIATKCAPIARMSSAGSCRPTPRSVPLTGNR